MLQEVLDAGLTKEQHRDGFRLEHNEDYLNLIWRGLVIAMFDAQTATVKAVRDKADRLMKAE